LRSNHAIRDSRSGGGWRHAPRAAFGLRGQQDPSSVGFATSGLRVVFDMDILVTAVNRRRGRALRRD
jgi:hypothetical protein